jgi:hypothetical protein
MTVTNVAINSIDAHVPMFCLTEKEIQSLADRFVLAGHQRSFHRMPAFEVGPHRGVEGIARPAAGVRKPRRLPASDSLDQRGRLMPGHVKPLAKFTVALLRGDEVLDARTAPTGEAAVKVAILLLAAIDALEHGDRMTVTEA